MIFRLLSSPVVHSINAWLFTEPYRRARRVKAITQHGHSEISFTTVVLFMRERRRLFIDLFSSFCLSYWSYSVTDEIDIDVHRRKRNYQLFVNEIICGLILCATCQKRSHGHEMNEHEKTHAHTHARTHDILKSNSVYFMMVSEFGIWPTDSMFYLQFFGFVLLYLRLC